MSYHITKKTTMYRESSVPQENALKGTEAFTAVNKWLLK